MRAKAGYMWFCHGYPPPHFRALECELREGIPKTKGKVCRIQHIQAHSHAYQPSTGSPHVHMWMCMSPRAMRAACRRRVEADFPNSSGALGRGRWRGQRQCMAWQPERPHKTPFQIPGFVSVAEASSILWLLLDASADYLLRLLVKR